MAATPKTIVWFRRDLRIDDNPALTAAARDGCVIPVYIWCPTEEGIFHPGRASRWWLKRSLAYLDHSLRSLGSALVFVKAENTLTALLQCIHTTGATKMVYNHLYDPISLPRDLNIKEKLVEMGISVEGFDGDLLHKPWKVYDEAGQTYTTFKAYWDKCLGMPIENGLLLPPWQLPPARVTAITEKCSIEELDLEDESEISSNFNLEKSWAPGCINADKILTQFLENKLIHYSRNKLTVGQSSTSLLSPYLHFGELSVRKVFYHVRMKQIQWAMNGNSVGEESAIQFLRAIGLREYSRYLCFNFPFTHERPLLESLEQFPWRDDKDHFKAWKQGRTGYPLVDAGMRELRAMGWVHNKIRVTVSSFLVKVLLLPWTWGLKYFWETLLDADLENQILGWQYISGSLPDGHQLNHLDSPQAGGKEYDPEGDYVRHWLPQLTQIPNEWIHCPWDAPLPVLRAAGVELGGNYPMPVINIEMARLHLNKAASVVLESEAASRDANITMEEQLVVRISASNENLANGGISSERTSNNTKLSHNQSASHLFEYYVKQKAMEITKDEDLSSTAGSPVISKQKCIGNQNSALDNLPATKKQKCSTLHQPSHPRKQFSDPFPVINIETLPLAEPPDLT